MKYFSVLRCSSRGITLYSASRIFIPNFSLKYVIAFNMYFNFSGSITVPSVLIGSTVFIFMNGRFGSFSFSLIAYPIELIRYFLFVPFSAMFVMLATIGYSSNLIKIVDGRSFEIFTSSISGNVR